MHAKQLGDKHKQHAYAAKSAATIYPQLRYGIVSTDVDLLMNLHKIGSISSPKEEKH